MLDTSIYTVQINPHNTAEQTCNSVFQRLGSQTRGTLFKSTELDVMELWCGVHIHREVHGGGIRNRS